MTKLLFLNFKVYYIIFLIFKFYSLKENLLNKKIILLK